MKEKQTIAVQEKPFDTQIGLSLVTRQFDIVCLNDADNLQHMKHETILNAHKEAIRLHKQGLGQRRIRRYLAERHNIAIPEATLSGWIHRGAIPFRNEQSQFKPKPVPEFEEPYTKYVTENQSAQYLSREYRVSTITVIRWLRLHRIQPRTQKESMSTDNVRNVLSECRLRRPVVEYQTLTPDKAYILGVAYGDGYLNNARLRLEAIDSDFLTAFKTALRTVYGLDFRIIRTSRETFKIDLTNHLICGDLLRYGPSGTFAWKVPEEILSSNNKCIITAFLRGMFDSEGSVSRYKISLTCKNREGVLQLSTLLTAIGIQSKVYHGKRGETILVICHRDNIARFARMIGFSIKRKKSVA